MLAAQVNERYKRVVYALQLGLILLVGVAQALELACWINKVAWIDAHLVSDLRCSECCPWVEMDVGNQWHLASLLAQLGAYASQVFGLFNALRGESHVVGSSLSDAQALLHACVYIVGRRVGHRLHPYGVVAAQWRVANVDSDSLASLIVEKVHDSCFI